MSSAIKKSRKKDSLSSTKKSIIKNSQSSVTKGKLIDFLVKTSQLQRKLQIIKQMLCQQQQFTPASLFHRLDISRKGFVSQKDIYDFLMQNNVSFKGSQLKLLYGKLNHHQSQCGINLRSFQNIILPSQSSRLRYYTMRRVIYVPLPHQKLNQKIQWIVTKLFTEIIKQTNKLMEVNTTLISSFDFDAAQTFQNLSSGEQYITAQSLYHFFRENNVDLKVEQIGCYVSTVDRTGQGRIYFQDFKYHLATLGLKKQHQIFDELSPIPALKNYQTSELTIVKDRDSTLKERYYDNKSYSKQQSQLVRSRRSNGLSRSRKNY